jgi:hypothetical protein
LLHNVYSAHPSRLTGRHELVYLAKDPKVMGLGFAATRDVVSFLRNDVADEAGNPNVVAGRIDHTNPSRQDSRFRFFMEELRSRMLSLTSSLTRRSRKSRSETPPLVSFLPVQLSVVVSRPPYAVLAAVWTWIRAAERKT